MPLHTEAFIINAYRAGVGDEMSRSRTDGSTTAPEGVERLPPVGSGDVIDA
jgi:hypothetical protein